MLRKRTSPTHSSHRYTAAFPAFALVALAWCIVKVWRIGPVVAVISSRKGWGVHSGDALALPCLALAAVCVHKMVTAGPVESAVSGDADSGADEMASLATLNGNGAVGPSTPAIADLA